MSSIDPKTAPWTPPYPASDRILGITWLDAEHKYPGSHGDTWATTWADDGHVYALVDDTYGLNQSIHSNLAIFRIEGTPPNHKLHVINPMVEYGCASGVEGRDTWKGAGLVSIDGVFYLGIGRHSGATDYPDNIQQALDGSIILSTDHGKTWSPKPTVPLFPGPRFATPFFVQFGRDYKDAMDEYVYIVSNANTWNNGNYMILARVPRRMLPYMDLNSWEFFAGADKENNPTWVKSRLASHVYGAKAIFQHRGFTSMAGIQYVPAAGRFILTQWAYMDLDLPKDGDNPWWLKTMLCLYEAPKPWGPWKLFHIEKNWGKGNYGPSIPSAWFGEEGRTMWMVYAGCWSTSEYACLTRKFQLRLSESK